MQLGDNIASNSYEEVGDFQLIIYWDRAARRWGTIYCNLLGGKKRDVDEIHILCG